MTVLFVIATIISFLAMDWAVQWSRARKGSPAPGTSSQPAAAGYPLRLPEGIFFAKSHTWLSLFPSGKVRLGLDGFVSRLLDNPKVTLLKSEGDRVEKGDPLILIEQDGRRMTVRAPLAGTIAIANIALQEDPQAMQKALFSKGWAYTMQPDKADDLRGLMLGEQSRHWMLAEFAKLRDLFSGALMPGALAPATLQDGGAPAPGALKHVGAQEWKRFEELFLDVR